MRSPHTVELYDFGVTDDGTFYYVMELLDGLDLTRWSAVGPVPAERAVHLLRQICDSLAEAHEAGLIHRDIKPANIYACRYGRKLDFVKVLDFGLVKHAQAPEPGADQLTADQLAGGTPAFMSPEQALGDKDVDGRSDLYAVGCVAYWLLTGTWCSRAQTRHGDHRDARATGSPSRPRGAPSSRSRPSSRPSSSIASRRAPRRGPQTADELPARLDAVALEREWTPARAANGGTSGPRRGERRRSRLMRNRCARRARSKARSPSEGAEIAGCRGAGPRSDPPGAAAADTWDGMDMRYSSFSMAAVLVAHDGVDPGEREGGERMHHRLGLGRNHALRLFALALRVRRAAESGVGVSQETAAPREHLARPAAPPRAPPAPSRCRAAPRRRPAQPVPLRLGDRVERRIVLEVPHRELLECGPAGPGPAGPGTPRPDSCSRSDSPGRPSAPRPRRPPAPSRDRRASTPKARLSGPTAPPSRAPGPGPDRNSSRRRRSARRNQAVIPMSEASSADRGLRRAGALQLLQRLAPSDLAAGGPGRAPPPLLHCSAAAGRRSRARGAPRRTPCGTGSGSTPSPRAPRADRA